LSNPPEPVTGRRTANTAEDLRTAVRVVEWLASAPQAQPVLRAMTSPDPAESMAAILLAFKLAKAWEAGDAH
jgi:hypothetical protein